MSVEHIYKRKAELENQWQHIQDHIDSTDYLVHTQLDELFDDATKAFEEVEEREVDLRHTWSQDPTDEQFVRVYRPFIRQMDNAQSHLTDLQQAVLYLEINKYQQSAYTERLSYVEELCEELSDQFGFSVSFLPVVWDGYAVFDIQRQDFYAVHVPRDQSSVHGSPIIAHEFGHVVGDYLTREDYQPFRDRLQEVVQEWPEKRQLLVQNSWRAWFDELVCDASGLLSFGPAYLLAMIERLLHRDPYELPRSQVYGHPPHALRYKFVDSIADRLLPSELYAQTEKARHSFEAHLKHAVNRPPANYEGWVDEALLDRIEELTREQLDSDLDSLCSNLLDEGITNPPEDQKYRYESNLHWLAD